MSNKRQLRSADDLLSPALSATIAEVPHLRPSDAAVVRLAVLYAEAIDGAEPDERDKALAVLGPRLLQALDALNATPKARAARAGARQEGPSHGVGQLAALRAARAH